MDLDVRLVFATVAAAVVAVNKHGRRRKVPGN